MAHEFKNVLFLITGMTPAIITETIWALACDPQLDESERWVPDEVHILSTDFGLDQIRNKLINSGVFEQFKKDYPLLAKVKFTNDFMRAIQDDDGTLLTDLKTPADNEYAANCINEHIKQLTQDENIALHVSIAGGRKTMGFYAGYALSLYGRSQDSLSHVLVDEHFETIRDFFYPTPYEHFVTDRDGRSWNANKARVWLANIPFVRMKYAIKEHHQIRTSSFSDTVNKINEANNDIQLLIEVKNKKITVNNKFTITDLPPKEFAFFCLFAHDRAQNGPGFKAPRGNANSAVISDEEFKYIMELSEKFLKFYSQLRDEMYLDENPVDVDKSYFESTKSNLQRLLNDALGLELASKLSIRSDKRRQPYYLDVDQKSITFK